MASPFTIATFRNIPMFQFRENFPQIPDSLNWIATDTRVKD